MFAITRNFLKSIGLIAVMLLTATWPALNAQAQLQPPQPPGVGAPALGEAALGDEEPEILTRGPLHEAFLIRPQVQAEPSPLLDQAPPAPIEELPPEIRPEDPSAIWIEGYWDYDPAIEDFLWVSGVWRIPPPGHRWLPGHWIEEDGGFRRIPGMWIAADAGALEYLEPPPESLEYGPTSPAPGDDYFYVNGCWTYNQGQYLWRTGYWAPFRPGWIWVPSYYAWVGRRVVFVNGYWDYPLERRGYPFAWLHFHRRPHFYRYRPSVYLPVAGLQFHLFFRGNSFAYHYGDYYGDRFTRLGYHPWYHGREALVQPLVRHYQWNYRRGGVDLHDRLGGWHRYFERHAEHRPAVRFTGDRDNGRRFDNDFLREIANPGRRLSDELAGARGSQFRRVTGEEAARMTDWNRQWRELGERRTRHENAFLSSRGENAEALSRSRRLELPQDRIPQINRRVETARETPRVEFRDGPGASRFQPSTGNRETARETPRIELPGRELPGRDREGRQSTPSPRVEFPNRGEASPRVDLPGRDLPGRDLPGRGGTRAESPQIISPRITTPGSSLPGRTEGREGGPRILVPGRGDAGRSETNRTEPAPRLELPGRGSERSNIPGLPLPGRAQPSGRTEASGRMEAPGRTQESSPAPRLNLPNREAGARPQVIPSTPQPRTQSRPQILQRPSTTLPGSSLPGSSQPSAQPRIQANPRPSTPQPSIQSRPQFNTRPSTPQPSAQPRIQLNPRSSTRSSTPQPSAQPRIQSRPQFNTRPSTPQPRIQSSQPRIQLSPRSSTGRSSAPSFSPSRSDNRGSIGGGRGGSPGGGLQLNRSRRGR